MQTNKKEHKELEIIQRPLEQLLRETEVSMLKYCPLSDYSWLTVCFVNEKKQENTENCQSGNFRS